MSLFNRVPDREEFEAADRRIRPYIHRTPVLTCRAINDLTGAELFFKCENFQKVGAFKFRGACNRVMALDDSTAAKGVVTHSSGNHAQALALAARMRQIPAYIVMPENAPGVKVAAVKGYGGKVTLCPPTQEARESATDRLIRDTGAHFIHPYDDYGIVAGAGTCAMEVFEAGTAPDIIMPAVGGGGLLSGTALATAYFSPRTRVMAAEPSGADDACRSMISGRIEPSIRPDTLADGLLTSLGELTFPIIRDRVEKILTCPDEMIVRAMRLIWERMKIVVESSGAVPLATVMAHPEAFRGKRVALIVSGGNVDLDHLPWQTPAAERNRTGKQ